MDKLYYIENAGCDDETQGLAIISDDIFPIFKNIITDLNKNSTYVCMPTIKVYQISNDDIVECTENDDYNRILYLGDKRYVFKNRHYDNDEKRVI